MARMLCCAAAVLGLTAMAAGPASGKEYGPGVSDTEIKIGQTAPLSGPGSAFSVFPKAASAYFRMLNEQGGVNGRKINLIIADDGYSPPKTVDQTRRLVEDENVFAVFMAVGTANSIAVRKYMNLRKVPQLFVTSGASAFGNYKEYPWSIGWGPTFMIEGTAFATYILKHTPNARIALLYQNDDFGKEYLIGLQKGLGDRAGGMIIKTQSYELTDPTIDSQIIALKASGADTLVLATTPKFGAQAIRQVSDIGWKPATYMSYASASVTQVMQPAGVERGIGVVSSVFHKDPSDPLWHDDKGYKDWIAFMDKYYPEGSKVDVLNVVGYNMAMTLVQVLRQCGDTLTRENLMREAARLDVQLPMVVDGIRVRTSPTNFYPIRSLRLARFDGKSFRLFGEMVSVPEDK
ncbi:ABC transporter substrate-binding protein [Vineibacter terrae]|uniref:ABC transporter substrate-binding protein n=1 Tax=Vineibacter terrae TaxID=2586908 RepID=UPI002E331621|nr:ABC transporter substrate-binding protein [Vineibacter terrae]HEX2887209.1 ABC transporter substrate-binding protein [Vineibacter terrae]